MGKNQWVLPRGESLWAVRGEGNAKDTKLFKTQREAQNFARSIAINQKSEVITKGTNGKIRSKDSYGNDPVPPRDKEH